MTTTYPVSSRSALATVGLSPELVGRAAGGLIAGGRPYLVGSLAAGLGTRASDVDIHVFRPELKQPVGSVLTHVGEVPVEVEQFPARAPVDLVGRVSDLPVTDSPWGPLSLAAAPDRSTCVTLARWTQAVPLWGPDVPPVLDTSAAVRALAVLVRASLETVVRAVAVARLAESVDPGGSSAQYLWGWAERCLTDLRCRAAGEVTTGEKWLSDRARRLGLACPVAVGDAAGFRRYGRQAGYPTWDEWTSVRLRVPDGTGWVEVGGRRFFDARHDRLYPDACDDHGPLPEVLGRRGAETVLLALRRGTLVLEIDHDILGEVVHGWATGSVPTGD